MFVEDITYERSYMKIAKLDNIYTAECQWQYDPIRSYYFAEQNSDNIAACSNGPL